MKFILACFVTDRDQVKVFVLVTAITAVTHPVIDSGAGDHSLGVGTVEGLARTGGGRRLVTSIKTVAVIIIHHPERNHLRLVQT